MKALPALLLRPEGRTRALVVPRARSAHAHELGPHLHLKKVRSSKLGSTDVFTRDGCSAGALLGCEARKSTRRTMPGKWIRFELTMLSFSMRLVSAGCGASFMAATRDTLPQAPPLAALALPVLAHVSEAALRTVLLRLRILRVMNLGPPHELSSPGTESVISLPCVHPGVVAPATC